MEGGGEWVVKFGRRRCSPELCPTPPGPSRPRLPPAGAPSFPVAGAIATASIIFVMLAEHGLAKAAEARLHARLRRMAGPAPAKGAACVPAAGGNIPGHLHGHSHDHAHGTPNKAAAAHPTTTTHHHTHSPDCDDVEAGGQGGERVRAAPHTDACCPPASPVCAGGDLSLATVHGTSQLHAHGHTHGPGEDCVVAARHAAVAQVLEFGIALHSVLIGITLGVLQTACAVRPLLAAITFHQFFEGLALGGCLVEAEYGARAFVGLGTLYALSTPMGVAIGLAIQARPGQWGAGWRAGGTAGARLPPRPPSPPTTPPCKPTDVLQPQLPDLPGGVGSVRLHFHRHPHLHGPRRPDCRRLHVFPVQGGRPASDGWVRGPGAGGGADDLVGAVGVR